MAAASSPPGGSVVSLHSQRGYPARPTAPLGAIPPMQQSTETVGTLPERIGDVAMSRISNFWLIFCSLPIIGTALAAYQMHIIHTCYVNEDAPRCPPGDSTQKIRASQDVGACLTAGLVSTVLTALIISQYLAAEALALTLGGLAFAAYWYTAGSSEAKNTAYLLSTQSQLLSTSRSTVV